jgi:hypothetical protein
LLPQSGKTASICRGLPAQVDADAAAVSSAGSPKSCSAWLCEAPRIYAVLARLASRRWPAPAFRRPCSLGGLVAYPPHSVWLHGHDAPEQRQLGTQEPDADCQVQCRLTLLPTRTRRRACLHYTCNNASESPWDSPITGIFPCPLCRAAQRQRLWPTAVHGTATRITQEGCTAAKNQCRCEPEAGIATCLRRGPPTQVSACCVVRWAPAACIASSNEPSRRSPGRLKLMAMGCTLGLGSRAPPVQAQDA